MKLTMFSSSISAASSCFVVPVNKTCPWHATRRSEHGQPRLPSFTVASNPQKQHQQKRQSANYHPTIWNPKLIESFSTPYNYELDGNRLEELKKAAKNLLASSSTKQQPCDTLKLIDSMQRLGVAYHFEEEIEQALNLLGKLDHITTDLNGTALRFRILREHGYPISTDVFEKFRNIDGKFNESLSDDIAGLLSLYEASFLGSQEEDDVLDEAKDFCTKHLKDISRDNVVVAEQVRQSLDMPLHWRVPRVEAQNFINLYQTIDDPHSLVLLELAKLDYNLVQSIHQQELKELARWWRDLGLKDKLSFSRDRLMENYLWAMSISFEPQFSKYRIGLTKFVCIFSAIDDIYDIYGSLDELELFTDAVKRWDIRAIDDLPHYMKICYFAMFNFANDIAYDLVKQHDGVNILSYIQKQWENLCTSYLVEARWLSSGYKPTAKEYLENSWVSVGGPAAIVHAYLLQNCHFTDHISLNCLKEGRELIYWSSLITRLTNDLGTSTAEIHRGDVVKSIQCYMNEKGISEKEARDQINGLISYSWRKLNEENKIARGIHLPKTMVKLCLNMARTARCIYQYGDGIGTSSGVTKDRLNLLILEPIPMDQTTS